MIPIGGKVSQWVLVAALATPLAASISLAADAPTRPEWCKPGWECVPTKEMVADSEYHLDLRSQVAQYRSRASRFGLTIGFGLGVGGVVDDDFNVRWVPTGGCFITWGLRF
jgi:hypothetical protein